jgi:hypothetical protein
MGSPKAGGSGDVDCRFTGGVVVRAEEERPVRHVAGDRHGRVELELNRVGVVRAEVDQLIGASGPTLAVGLAGELEEASRITRLIGRFPDAELRAPTMRVGAELEELGVLGKREGLAVLATLKGGHLLNKDLVGVEDTLGRPSQLLWVGACELDVQVLSHCRVGVGQVEGVGVPDDDARHGQERVHAVYEAVIDEGLLRA